MSESAPLDEATAKKNSLNKEKRRQILINMGLIFLILFFMWFFYWLLWGRFKIYTDNAYVQGNLIRLMPQISGTVIGINTDDALFVTEGQALVTLDKSDMQIAFDRAEASLAQTVRDTRQLYENVIQTEAEVALRKVDLEKTKFDLKRRQGLIGERAISKEEMQHYQIFVDTAEAQYINALAKYDSALAQVKDTNLYNHPAVLRAKLNFKNAYLNLQRTVIYAPVTGFVAKRAIQVGEQVTPNSALMTIIPLNQIWVDANYKESQLERLRVGQPVSLIVDAYSGTEYHGKILGLTPGTGSSFDLLPPQNATGNWIKIVQRVPVRIELDPKELREHPLLIGLSVRATTYTRKLKGQILNRIPNQKAIYSTNIFDKQLANVDQTINTIVKSNGSDVTLESLKLNTGMQNGKISS